jgi:hypothetical protein
MDELRNCFTEEVRIRVPSSSVYADACYANGAVGYGPIEAEVPYAYMTSKRPPRMVQIGAGVSTAVMLAAAVRATSAGVIEFIKGGDNHSTGDLPHFPPGATETTGFTI